MLNFDSTKFFVQCENNTDFIDRQKSVFEKLDAVVNHKEATDRPIPRPRPINNQTSKRQSAVTGDQPYKKQKQDLKQFRGKESIFKRPEAPPPARFKRNIPEYQRYPHKWTKYTLSDVSQEDMSDRSNTAAAMSFLRDIQSRKVECMEVDSSEVQIKFKRPNKLQGLNKPTSLTIQSEVQSEIPLRIENPSFRSSKLMMPEYVVGEKKVTKKTRPKSVQEKSELRSEIKLNHLVEEDED